MEQRFLVDLGLASKEKYGGLSIGKLFQPELSGCEDSSPVWSQTRKLLLLEDRASIRRWLWFVLEAGARMK